MPARVHITQAEPGGPLAVTVDGHELPDVYEVAVQAGGDRVAHVGLRLTASTLDLDLPAAAYISQPGPTVAQFVESLDPQQLEQAALENVDDRSMGESFVAALQSAAADYAS